MDTRSALISIPLVYCQQRCDVGYDLVDTGFRYDFCHMTLIHWLSFIFCDTDVLMLSIVSASVSGFIQQYSRILALSLVLARMFL